METAAVPARRSLAPLADLALLAAVAAASWFGLRAFADVPNGPGFIVGVIVGATLVGGAIVIRYGHTELRLRTLAIVVVTGLILVPGTVMVIFAGLCDTTPNQPWIAWAGMGVVYFGLGLLSLRKRFLWGLPIAIFLALVTFLTTWHWLPGTYSGCFN